MIIENENNTIAVTVNSPEAKNAAMKTLIAPEQGWQGHVMRIVELGPQGYSPRHIHPWPHINYVIEGEGTLLLHGKEQAISAGTYAYVPADEEHQYRNSTDSPLRFICIVPEEGHIT